MKRIKYFILSISAVINAFVAFIMLDSKLVRDVISSFLPSGPFSSFDDVEKYKNSYMLWSTVAIAIITLIGLGLTVAHTKALLADSSLHSKKALLWTSSVSAFVATGAGVGAYYAFCSKIIWLFLVLFAFAFAALSLLVTGAYRWLKEYLKGHSRVGDVVSIVFAVLCLPMALVAVSCARLATLAGVDVMGFYAASIVVCALLSVFGVAVLVSLFVKRFRFSWTKPTAAFLIGVILCLFVISVFVTGASTGTGNFIKNVAIDIGIIRLGLSDEEYICAYKGNGGERIYLLEDGHADSDAELSELLQGVKIGDVYHRTVNGVEYKHIFLDFFGGFYIFTVIPV